jgi:hypothetical protein
MSGKQRLQAIRVHLCKHITSEIAREAFWTVCRATCIHGLRLCLQCRMASVCAREALLQTAGCQLNNYEKTAMAFCFHQALLHKISDHDHRPTPRWALYMRRKLDQSMPFAITVLDKRYNLDCITLPHSIKTIRHPIFRAFTSTPCATTATHILAPAKHTWKCIHTYAPRMSPKTIRESSIARTTRPCAWLSSRLAHIVPAVQPRAPARARIQMW